MFVPVYPASPSSALTAAVIGAGYQPVPVEDVATLVARTPPDGWAAAIVEVVEDLGRCLSVAAKIGGELGVPVLLVIDRTMTLDVHDQAGFTDFILSPIDRVELTVRMARLGAAVLDSSEAAADEELLRFRDLELNTATYQATVGGHPRDLTFMEYELLRFFVENPGRAWSREQILAKVWGYDYFGGSRTVDVHVRRLRAKLGEERSSWITTVRSVGYRFG
jgi:DNA-binding response OmpR family regulator